MNNEIKRNLFFRYVTFYERANTKAYVDCKEIVDYLYSGDIPIITRKSQTGREFVYRDTLFREKY